MTTSLITSTLVAIRAAHHPDVDRVVFEFAGPLPRTHDVRSVAQVIADASGQPVPLAGDAFLQVRMSPAIGHDEGGGSTYGAPSLTYALPEVIQVVNLGRVLPFGIGLARTSGFRTFTLTDPNRLVIDIDAAFRTMTVTDFPRRTELQRGHRAVHARGDLSGHPAAPRARGAPMPVRSRSHSSSRSSCWSVGPKPAGPRQE